MNEIDLQQAMERPEMVEVLRTQADHHYALAQRLDEMANHCIRMEEDPEYARKIRDAEDIAIGDELLMEMQREGSGISHQGSGKKP